MSDVTGIDVSHYNALANLGSQEFQFAKATQGVYKDAKFLAHTANAERYGVVAGAYHFGVAGSASAQVDAFLAAVKPTGIRLLALDLEHYGTQTMTNGHAAEFIAAVQLRGYPIGLYHSRSGFPKLGQDWDWIADWNANDFPNGCLFWQYQGNPIDRDRFNGTLSELRVVAGLQAPPPIIGGGNEPAKPPQGDDVRYVNANGYSVESGLVINVGKGAPWKYLNGIEGGKVPADTALPVVGFGDGDPKDHVVLLNTGNPYADGKPRPTLVLIRSSNDPYKL